MRVVKFSLASAVALIALLAPAGLFADSFDDLQTHTGLFQNVLTQDSADHAADQADRLVESRPEFFPQLADESSASSVSSMGVALSPFVAFHLNGAEYVLTDVPLTQWFAPYVRDVADRGIVSGYRDSEGIPTGIFGPERNVSIEELAKMALEAVGFDHEACSGAPKNVAAQKSWSALYIRCAELKNFAVYADGSVDIRRPAFRGEVVMTVLQAFGVSLRDSPPTGTKIKDVTASTLFSSAIYTALHDGIVSGFADTQGNPTGFFGPEKPVNRAEVSKIISLALQVYGEK